MALLFDALLDFVPVFQTSPKEREAKAKVKSWIAGGLDCTDESLIDSSRGYLLLATRDKLFLVERRGSWKGELDDFSLERYLKRGTRAFGSIKRHLANPPQ
ncbi:MAG: hypothetical protein AAF226_12255 [Verrucomicrobiota bacterium]